MAHFEDSRSSQASSGKKSPTTHLTQPPCELWSTLAREAVQHCVALAAVLAGFAGALVPLDLAVRANEARGTQAAEASRTLLRTINTQSQRESPRGTGVRLWWYPNLAGGSVLALAVAAFQVCRGQQWISKSRFMVNHRECGHY